MKNIRKKKESSKPKHYVTPEKAEKHAELLANRVRKRFRHLSRKYRRQKIDCFRLYDWDIKEVRAVVDWYAGHLVVAEYVRLQTGPEYLPRMAKAVGEALDIPPEKVHIKRRQTNTKKGPRYKQLGKKGERFVANERDFKFWINLDDYLDTGLYSDHRDTRVIVRDVVKGKDFLNLYAYTGAFTCAAAAGGARSTFTVDRAATYIEWAKDNMKLNKLAGGKHTFVKSDVGRFLKRAEKQGLKFNVAVVDPPSFFKDKIKGTSFDINRAHPELLRSVAAVMAPRSIVFFSTNHQRFDPHFKGLPFREIIEITPKTIPEDFHNRRVHRCWKMVV